jgi:hypothetical protein
MWRNCMLPPYVARPIRNDGSAEKFGVGRFFARARDFLYLVIEVCAGVYLNRVSDSH